MSDLRKLPDLLSPLVSNHPASVAYRITLSPHEWAWTQAEQEAMASALVERDGELHHLRIKLTNAEESLKLADELVARYERYEAITERRISGDITALDEAYDDLEKALKAYLASRRKEQTK